MDLFQVGSGSLCKDFWEGQHTPRSWEHLCILHCLWWSLVLHQWVLASPLSNSNLIHFPFLSTPIFQLASVILDVHSLFPSAPQSQPAPVIFFEGITRRVEGVQDLSFFAFTIVSYCMPHHCLLPYHIVSLKYSIIRMFSSLAVKLLLRYIFVQVGTFDKTNKITYRVPC